jgi:hypothetical protein
MCLPLPPSDDGTKSVGLLRLHFGVMTVGRDLPSLWTGARTELRSFPNVGSHVLVPKGDE